MKQASEFIIDVAVAAKFTSSGVTIGDAGDVVLLPMAEAFAEYGDILRRSVPQTDGGSEGLFIYLKKGVSTSIPLYVAVDGCRSGDRCVVVAEDDSSAEIGFLMSDSDSFVRETYVGDGAKIVLRDISIANAERSVKLNSIMRLAQRASAETVTVELGEGETTLDYEVRLNGAEANAVHYGIFIAADGEKKYFGVRVEHNVADCKSDVLVKGVAAGSGRGSFSGMVYVAQDAQHTEAYQQSRNLILGPMARILTSPQLEIYADDVKCSHGATVGQMNDEALFYMRQRGLSDAQARGLQLSGFVNDVIFHLGEGELAEKVSVAAQRKIDNLH